MCQQNRSEATKKYCNKLNDFRKWKQYYIIPLYISNIKKHDILIVVGTKVLFYHKPLLALKLPGQTIGW